MDGVIIDNKMYRVVPFDSCDACDIKDICMDDLESKNDLVSEYGIGAICKKFETENGDCVMFEGISGTV